MMSFTSMLVFGHAVLGKAGKTEHDRSDYWLHLAMRTAFKVRAELEPLSQMFETGLYTLKSNSQIISALLNLMHGCKLKKKEEYIDLDKPFKLQT